MALFAVDWERISLKTQASSQHGKVARQDETVSIYKSIPLHGSSRDIDLGIRKLFQFMKNKKTKCKFC